MLTKLIPLALIVGLGAAGAPKMADQMDYLTNFAKITATHAELSNYKKLLIIEMIEYGRAPVDGEWQQIIRSQIDGGERDPLVDMWGYYVNYWYQDWDFALFSAGPDATLNTDDDVVVRYNQ
ncbi:MAG: hypothetical protein ABIH66_09815 [bacterium]